MSRHAGKVWEGRFGQQRHMTSLCNPWLQCQCRVLFISLFRHRDSKMILRRCRMDIAQQNQFTFDTLKIQSGMFFPSRVFWLTRPEYLVERWQQTAFWSGLAVPVCERSLRVQHVAVRRSAGLRGRQWRAQLRECHRRRRRWEGQTQCHGSGSGAGSGGLIIPDFKKIIPFFQKKFPSQYVT